MRLIDIGAVYLLVGVMCAIAVARRPSPTHSALTDAALSLVIWPLYVPAILAPPSPRLPDFGDRASSSAMAREHALLVSAVEAVREPAVASLLPTHDQLSLLANEILKLDAKVRELSEVLSQSDFDPERNASAPGENGRLVRESIQRLTNLRTRATRDRDDLISLCQRLRIRLTVLRFAGSSADVGDVVGELLSRLEGVDAAFCDAAPSSGRRDEEET